MILDNTKKHGIEEVVKTTIKAPEGTEQKATTENRNTENRGFGFRRDSQYSKDRPFKRQDGLAKDSLKRAILSVRRVAKVRDGGKRLSFSVLVAIGDGKGKIGIGTGNAAEVNIAIEQATTNAKKHLQTVKLHDNRTISHDVSGHYCATTVILRKAIVGRGIVAGKIIKSMMECLGGESLDIVSKIYGSRNPHNVAKAVLLALNPFIKSREYTDIAA